MGKSVYKDQRGVAQVVIIIIVLTVVGAAGFAGWRVMQNNKKPAVAKTTAGRAINDSCMKIYNDKNLCYAAAASSDFEKLPYVTVVTSTDAKGQASKLTLESDGKGNTTLNTESGGQSFGTVTIGDTIYTKTAGSSTWTKYTSSTPDTDTPANDLKTQFSDSTTPADKRIQYKSLGKEKCGSGTCFKYQVTDPAIPDTTTFVWFSTKDYRLQRMSAKTAEGTTEFVVTYKSVKISAPSPVSETPSVPTGTPTQADIDAAMEAARQYAQ